MFKELILKIGQKFEKNNIPYMIIHKVISGRSKDLEDIKNILIINKIYNKKYIIKWLKEFDKTLKSNYQFDI